MDHPKTWYEYRARQFEADTAHLSCEEVGAYQRLLNFHFLNGSIPGDLNRIKNILRESKQKTRKLWATLEPFFYSENGCFYQKRMVETIAKATEISTKRREAGRKGGLANAEAKGVAKSKTVTETVTIKNKPLVRTAARFDEWWDVFANKKNRKGALKIWKARNLDDIADDLIADAKKRHAEDDSWRRGFQPHPTTYLNGDRWEDEIEKPKSRPSTDPFPKDPNQITAWAQRHGMPLPKAGEEAWQYKQRIGA